MLVSIFRLSAACIFEVIILWNMVLSFQDISLENVSSMYELSEAFNAISLRHTCVLFILEQFDKLSARPGYVLLPFQHVPDLVFFTFLTQNFCCFLLLLFDGEERHLNIHVVGCVKVSQPIKMYQLCNRKFNKVDICRYIFFAIPSVGLWGIIIFAVIGEQSSCRTWSY